MEANEPTEVEAHGFWVGLTGVFQESSLRLKLRRLWARDGTGPFEVTRPDPTRISLTRDPD